MITKTPLLPLQEVLWEIKIFLKKLICHFRDMIKTFILPPFFSYSRRIRTVESVEQSSQTTSPKFWCVGTRIEYNCSRRIFSPLYVVS